ncbi:A/G-specific adenine glycosylase [Hallerella porci]|uniref:Adenine DNA glycosylase n=1 Tax=Hallerella porci TaxID=1945871 RepID=A0ABX5LS84_9BACT|nr:A/G-specific adenine glycosylase [Hallerella porci]PWL03906.1 A/G-specific DNA-adenine glycosylase [Hallerella porci]
MRIKRDPYAVWISETMLQQTQVSAVKEAFEKWMHDFPTVKILAEASEENVLIHWQGLGYYSRAKNIHKTAKIIAQNGENFPETRKELEALPGIGAYTAGAILSLAFHQNESILDGNLVRIFARLNLFSFLPDAGKTEKKSFWDEARKWATIQNAFLTNEALMELGRKICKKSNPDCKNCPLQKICRAAIENRQEEFPVKKKMQYESWLGFALVVSDSHENFLLQNSPDSPFFKNQWTFPLFENADIFRENFPGIIENIIPPETIQHIAWGKSFEHSITRYKIRCRILQVQVKSRKDLSGEWISKKDISKKIVSSFGKKILSSLEFSSRI